MLPFTRQLFPTPRAVGTFTTAATRRNTKASNNPPSNLSEGEQNIYAKLTAKFTPSQLQVQDVSGVCHWPFCLFRGSPRQRRLWNFLRYHNIMLGIPGTFDIETAQISHRHTQIGNSRNSWFTGTSFKLFICTRNKFQFMT